MKNYIIALLFFIGADNFCQAQDTVEVDVPQLLESKKIDSLIAMVIKSPENLTVLKNDSCLLLSFFKNETFSFIHGIHATNNRETIYSTGNFEQQENAGFFETNGYLVFVYGDETTKNFFANTHQTKEFTFIKPTIQQNIFVIVNYLNLSLSYNQGAFSFKKR